MQQPIFNALLNIETAEERKSVSWKASYATFIAEGVTISGAGSRRESQSATAADLGVKNPPTHADFKSDRDTIPVTSSLPVTFLDSCLPIAKAVPGRDGITQKSVKMPPVFLSATGRQFTMNLSPALAAKLASDKTVTAQTKLRFTNVIAHPWKNTAGEGVWYHAEGYELVVNTAPANVENPTNIAKPAETTANVTANVLNPDDVE